jgi:hypothetical protein
VKYENNRNHAKGETIMLKRRIAVLLPILALSLSVLACNFPGIQSLDAQASELSKQEIAALVDAASQDLEVPAGDSQALPVVDEPQEDISGEPDAGVQDDPQVEPDTAAEPDPIVTEEPAPPEIETCTDRAQFVADVTVEDGADFAPDQSFTKTWRLRNNGTCTWTSSYDLVFDHGDHMGGPAVKALPGIVEPGEMVDISVDLVAPSAEGGYIGYWLLRNGEGMLFGIGADADIAFWVEIEVLEEDDGDGGLPPLEIFPIPAFPVFVSNGTGQNLPSGACFDLDGGAVVSCANGDADFRYFAEFEMVGFPPIPKLTLEVQPRNGARFALFGDDLPTGSDCQASGLSGSAVKIQQKTYCYQTDAGKYGRITIVNGDLGSLTFDWATYTFP